MQEQVDTLFVWERAREGAGLGAWVGGVMGPASSRVQRVYRGFTMGVPTQNLVSQGFLFFGLDTKAFNLG
jgi:hypothetical protein